MKPENLTATSNFILLGLSKEDAIQPLLFGLFLLICLVCIIGKLFIILVIGYDFYLWTPMYSFLCNLSVTDICFISTIVPKMLVNIQAQNKSITYKRCLTQMYFFHVFFSPSGLGSLLLTLMSYDQYVAICYPLCYMIIMNPPLCGLLFSLSWLISLTYSLLQTLMFLRVSFCKKQKSPTTSVNLLKSSSLLAQTPMPMMSCSIV